MERLTRWEGRDPDGTPRAVLAKRDGNWNDNIQEALRKLADYEDILEAEEQSWLAHLSGMVSVEDMHDRAEAERQKSLLMECNMDHSPINSQLTELKLTESDVAEIIQYLSREAE